MCLIPDIPFRLAAVVEYVQKLQAARPSQGVVICTACAGPPAPDGSSGTCGARALGAAAAADVAAGGGAPPAGWLRDALRAALPDSDVKAIDPTLSLRAAPCSAADHVLCKARFGTQQAARPAFAGCPSRSHRPTHRQECRAAH